MTRAKTGGRTGRLRVYIVELLTEKGDLTTGQVLDYCIKRYPYAASTNNISNILPKVATKVGIHKFPLISNKGSRIGQRRVAIWRSK